MSRSIALPYNFQWSSTHPHVAWADIHNNGVLTEIAVVSLDNRNGDLYFIPIASLDRIDVSRLTNILTKRDAGKYPLWDLMDNSTLKNGMNALEYFNQLVKVKSLSGQIFSPNAGRMGALNNQMSARPNVRKQATVAVPTDSSVLNTEYAGEDAQVESAPRKSPGRPPRAK